MNQSSYYCLAAWGISLAIIFAVIISGGYLHFVSYDTLHGITIARRMLGGEIIYRDFFEVNHPVHASILWVGVFLHSLFPYTDDIKVVHGVLFAFGLMSAILTWRVVSLSKEWDSPYFQFTFISVLCFIIFLLPLQTLHPQFGQKEHLFVMFFLPYLHTYLLDDQIRRKHPFLMVCAGMLGGIGLCMKVFLFIIPIIIELSLMIVKRSFWSFWRLENIAAACITFKIITMVWVLTPEYVDVVIPTALVTYNPASLWINTLLFVSVNFIFLVLFADAVHKSSPYYALLKVAVVGAFISILLQVSGFQQVTIPVLSIGTLMSVPLIAGIWKHTVRDLPYEKENKITLTYAAPILWVIVTLLVPISMVEKNVTEGYPRSYKEYVERHKIDYFRALGKQYEKDGGALFLTYGFNPQLYMWAYDHASWNGYFHGMYLIDGLHRYYKKHQLLEPNEKTLKIEQMIRDAVINDIREDNPALIIVEKGHLVKDTESGIHYTLQHFVDYIDFFSKEEEFNELWKQYTFTEEVKNEEYILDCKNNKYECPVAKVYHVYIRNDLLPRK